ncbi:hypothetical protein ACTXL8_05365 [Glutamicibacter arilaitensis]|uniref:hypothetical protein n=1 Tax=Glutamicibacter arilaitensis TaxID=256701 RepID=UPI003FD35E62
MSEFKCPEPGCNYHVGNSNGPNLTAEDWETEDYYFQEIEEHQQMHVTLTSSIGKPPNRGHAHIEASDKQIVVSLAPINPLTSSELDGIGSALAEGLTRSGFSPVPNPSELDRFAVGQRRHDAPR